MNLQHVAALYGACSFICMMIAAGYLERKLEKLALLGVPYNARLTFGIGVILGTIVLSVPMMGLALLTAVAIGLQQMLLGVGYWVRVLLRYLKTKKIEYPPHNNGPYR